MWHRLRLRPRMAAPTIRHFSRQVEHGQTITVHRVRFSQQKRYIRRAFDVCIVVYACSVFYAQIVLVPLDKAITKAVKGLPAVEDDGKDAVQSIFMPFPLTTKKIRPPPYSGRDPEWQAFIKLSKDKEANTSMRKDLAEIVRNEVGRSQLAQRLGSPIKVRRWWLDAEYPFGPPPEYRRSGLQYDQQGWKWTERPVDEKTAMRLERVLWPSALGWSIFAFAATCLQQNVREVQKHFGLQPSHQGSPSAPGGGATALSSAAKTEMQRTLHRLRQRTSRRPEEVQDPGALGSSQPVDGAGGASGPGANTAPTRPGNQARNAPGVARPGPKELFPGHAWIRSMIGPKPWEAFRMTLAQLWRPVVPHPPKGCVIVTGLVELETPRGWVIIDVLAGFDPTTRNYDGESLRLKVRRIQPRQQSPRR